MESIEIHNRGSILFDHTTYWDNRDHFLGVVACAVANLADIDVRSEGALRIAKDRRRWRVQRLVAARWTFIIIALVMPLWLWRWDRLPSSTSDLPRFLSQVPGWITDRIVSVSEWLSLIDVSVTGAELQSQIVQVTAVATLLGVVVIGYFGIYLIWRWWEGREVRRFFSRKGFELSNMPMALFLLLHVLAVFAALGWIFMPHEADALRGMIVVSILFVALYHPH